jgi:uncharacterized membrane protein YidH (DUF202 family)
MPRIFHFFYVLLSDEELLKEAWRKLSDYFKLKEDAGENWITASEESRLRLHFFKHVGALELSISAEDAAEGLSRIEKGREEVGAFIEQLIGESTAVIHDRAGEVESFPCAPIKSMFMGREMSVCPAEEGTYRRYYAMRDGYQLEKLIPIDCLLFQGQRQARYYEGQLEVFSKKREELDRKAAEVLFRKKASLNLDILESDLDELSEVYGLMANYRFLLRDAVYELNRNLGEIERLLQGLISEDDPFFQYRHIFVLRSLLKRLAENQREFNLSLEGAKSAIDVIKGRIELARSRTSLAMQEESLTLAAAASLVEFFLVLYYGLQTWKTLTGNVFNEIPIYLSAGLAVVFSAATVAGTHKVARALKSGKPKDLLMWGFLLLGLVALAVSISLLYAH